MNSRRIVIACVIAIGLATQAQAASLEIKVTGLDLAYDEVFAADGSSEGFSIHDASNIIGGNGNPAVSTPLSTMEFLVDGATVGTTLTTDIWADIRIDVEDIPAVGGIVVTSIGSDFGYDLLTSSAGWGLALDLDQFTVFYDAGAIEISGGGLASQIIFQDLPFLLELSDTDDVSVSFKSTSMSNITSSGGFLTGFDASGTGEVKGVLVPEPASATMLLMAGLGLVGLGRRRS